MRQGKGLYWKLFEFAPEAYVVSTPGGAIREANRLARQMLNADKAALIDTSLFDLLAESDRDAFQWVVRRLQVTGWPRQPVELAALVKARNALPFVAQISASALGDDEHEPDALAWMMRPVSPARDAKLAILAETSPAGPRELARRVDVGLLPVVGAVGQSLRHPGLPPDLKLALAQAAVSLDSAVQWMGNLERAVRGDELGPR